MELADILKEHLSAYKKRHKLSVHQNKVLRGIMNCRTIKLGAHVSRCNKCGYTEISYNSCRDRHCPKCQFSKMIEWVEARLSDILPILYFHEVFTLPDILDDLILLNKKLMYNALFETSSETLKVFGADPKYLGGQLGFIGILHTWGQTLSYHVHIHYIVAAGGLSFDGKDWIKPKYEEDFLFPVRAMSKVFRGKFIEKLRELHPKLKFAGKIDYLSHEIAFEHFLDDLSKKRFHIYSKKPFDNGEQVMKYLGRYTHRVAISNKRLLEMKDGEVAFSYKDYKDGDKQKVMRLRGEEFIRRFLTHILPEGFQKIRHYGFLSGSVKSEKLRQIRSMLKVVKEQVKEIKMQVNGFVCPSCKQGVMCFLEEVVGEVISKAFPIAKPDEPGSWVQSCPTSI